MSFACHVRTDHHRFVAGFATATFCRARGTPSDAVLGSRQLWFSRFVILHRETRAGQLHLRYQHADSVAPALKCEPYGYG